MAAIVRRTGSAIGGSEQMNAEIIEASVNVVLKWEQDSISMRVEETRVLVKGTNVNG